MNLLTHPFPFSFDGHGVNDADGRRLLTVSSAVPLPEQVLR